MQPTSRRSQRSIAALLIAICSVPVAHADLYSGLAAYEKRDFDTAFKEMESLAKLGNPAAQYALGIMYQRGEGASRNSLLAYGWLQLAADSGHAEAGKVLPQLRSAMAEEGIEAAQRLVANFTPAALKERLMPKILANCDFQSMTAPKGKKIAPPEYPLRPLHAGISGSVLLELTVAPDGTVRDTRIVRAFPPDMFEEAVLKVAPGWIFHPALKDGKPTTAVTTFGANFDIKGGESFEMSQWLRKIRKQAEEGNAAAQYIHGVALVSDPDDKKPWSEALPWLTKSAQAGLAIAQYELGESLWAGRGCEADPVKAMEWLQMAARQEEPNAQLSLARIAFAPGPNFEPDKGLFWLRRAAALGHKRANKYLAAIMAASPNENIRAPQLALEALDKIERGDKGEPTTLEIRAAALAASGDFKHAVTTQKSAVQKAQRLGWDIGPMEQRLAQYQANQPWFGDLVLF